MSRRLLPVALVGVLAACGGTTTEPVAAPATSAAQTSAPAPANTAPAATAPTATDSVAPSEIPANVPEALRFTAPLLGGGDIEMATLASRPVLLWFWAPW